MHKPDTSHGGRVYRRLSTNKSLDNVMKKLLVKRIDEEKREFLYLLFDSESAVFCIQKTTRMGDRVWDERWSIADQMARAEPDFDEAFALFLNLTMGE